MSIEAVIDSKNKLKRHRDNWKRKALEAEKEVERLLGIIEGMKCLWYNPNNDFPKYDPNCKCQICLAKSRAKQEVADDR